MAHIVVLGNEKGGCGKSTVAMHLAAWLGREGKSVGAIDLDIRQRSFHRYLENRQQYSDEHGVSLVTPEVAEVTPSVAKDRDAARVTDEKAIGAAIERLAQACEFVIIDTPGAHTNFAAYAHRAADTLITPINDSFVDFDMLAKVSVKDGSILGPSVYAQAVWDARKERTAQKLPPIDWIVMRNRIDNTTDARNKRRVQASVDRLSEQIGFRVVPGFGERVIFKELFLSGLTLLDMDRTRYSLSHVTARQELRELITALNLGEAQDAEAA